MKKTVKIFVLILLAFSLALTAQEEKKDFSIQFSGFIKNDFFYDSRQTVNIREGHFLLYPADFLPDADNRDINAEASLNFLSIQTRLTCAITSPDAFGARVKGVIEADFFGNENAAFVDVNGFRLRHAYAQLSWEKTQLLLGQYWHPLFIPGCFSEVISFNTGSPIQPFSRNPQIRVIHHPGKFHLIAAVSAQRDFTSAGGSNVLRNSALPEFQAQVQYEIKNTATRREFLAGFGGGVKWLRPLLNTEADGKKYVTDQTLSSYSFTAFAKMKCPAFTCKLQGVYGTNLYDLLMIGGYGVSTVTDPLRNTVAYTATRTLSVWSEGMTQGKTMQLGLWAGFTSNLGGAAPILYYSDRVGGTLGTVRGANIKSILRISPRLVLISGKFNFALETEYTSAAYAAKDEFGNLSRDSHGVIDLTQNLANMRVLFATILKF
ncbi:MAG: hypothetical protein KJ808_01420 [Acidobacteria bacterium]|nr:hypothetical protein [Acidobacteriota bacterium]MBU4405871.1 hypothetical protein [Acidobacteriota bacterium]MCG2811327.1 hypothetical protein [Candidatus Aminicenantes bacterium]